MGACASVPKDLKAEAAAPEPAKEEATATATPEPAKEEATATVPAVEPQPEEKDGDKPQSLGTLLVEGEAPKEESNSEAKTEESEESKAEALPVSDKATSEDKEKEVAESK